VQFSQCAVQYYGLLFDKHVMYIFLFLCIFLMCKDFSISLAYDSYYFFFYWQIHMNCVLTSKISFHHEWMHGMQYLLLIVKGGWIAESEISHSLIFCFNFIYLFRLSIYILFTFVYLHLFIYIYFFILAASIENDVTRAWYLKNK
jgi:hypothetical protein